ncbi:hypothetical protein JTE90_023706 [Oedothorax gibbosus]|uniref:C2H2-type domain-containing protein n=2 Tax=Oedothorax gibbosus TaxID=931172 RepID=A0AAV6TNP4_9ARAC|nr:hypothetical protein JTE90_023706 [Oedothorax gibbosus]
MESLNRVSSCPLIGPTINSSPLYVRYHNLIYHRKACLVTCPFSCSGDPMSFGEFLRVHMKEVHQVNASHACPFCLGRFQWLRQEARSEMVNRHRLECMKALFPELFHSRVPKIRPNEQREQSQLFAEIKQLHHDLVCEGRWSESKLKEQIRNLLLDHDAAEITKLRAQLSTLEEARNQREQLIQEKEQLIQMHEQLIQMHEQLSFSLREHQRKLVKV